jgi:hypothetical protein
MFGAVDIKHPKLLPASRESVTAVRRRGAQGKIKALCRVEERGPEFIPNLTESLTIPEIAHSLTG